MAANNSCENSGDECYEYQNIPSPHIPPQKWALYNTKPVIPSETGSTHQPQKVVQSQSLSHLTKVKESTPGEYANVNLKKTPLTLSHEMTLEQFVFKHEGYLPLQVKISKGIYGTDDESTISTGECYNFHFMQNRDLVKVEDKYNQQEFSIPVNSPIKFSIVYNPYNNEQQAIRGLIFPKVSGILAMPSLPKVVCTTRAWDSGKFNSSVSTDEILIVREVVELQTSEGESGRRLRVYSIRDHFEKYLDENCCGHFSTRPTRIQLYLTDIFRYFSNPLPMHVVLSLDPTSTVTVPSYLFSRILHVSHKYTDVLVVCTGVLEGKDVAEAEVFEIPTNLDIELAIVELSESENKELIAETAYLLDKIKEKNVRHYRYVNVPDEIYQMEQSLLALTPACDADKKEYSEPQERNRLALEHRLQLLEFQSHRYHKDVSSLTTELSSFSEEMKKDYECLEFKVAKQSDRIELCQDDFTSVQTQCVALQGTVELCQHDFTSVQTQCVALQGTVELCQHDFTSIQKQCEGLQGIVERQAAQLQVAQAEINSLRDEVSLLNERLQRLSSPAEDAMAAEKQTSESSLEEENRTFLGKLDQHKVG